MTKDELREKLEEHWNWWKYYKQGFPGKKEFDEKAKQAHNQILSLIEQSGKPYQCAWCGREYPQGEEGTTSIDVKCCRCGKKTLFYVIAPYGCKDDGNPICAECLDLTPPAEKPDPDAGELEYTSSHDSEAGAYYIALIQHGKIAKTISPLDFCNIDLDANGRVVGIELLQHIEVKE